MCIRDSFRITSVYAPAEVETNASLEYFKQVFNPVTLDPDMYNIVPGDWNCGLTDLDHMNYVDWKKHRPRTRNYIQNGMIENFLCDPYRFIHEASPVSVTEGWTWYNQTDENRKQKDKKHLVKRSRLDYILVSEKLMDYISHASITKPPFGNGTDHRMTCINIEFNSFVTGMGYYRCPPELLHDEIFKGVLRTSVCLTISQLSLIHI